MGLAIETIKRLKDRNGAGGPGGLVIQETTIETRQKRIEAETQRQAGIRDCITAFNNQITVDPELRQTVATALQNHPQKTSYISRSRYYSGVAVAKDFVETALLTEKGIECFRLRAPLNFIPQGKWQTYQAAEPIPLEEAGMGYVFSQTEFPSAQDVTQKIQALLAVKLKQIE